MRYGFEVGKSMKYLRNRSEAGVIGLEEGVLLGMRKIWGLI